MSTDVPDIWFRFVGLISGYFSNPVLALVLAKTVPGNGYLCQIVIGPFSQLVNPQNRRPGVITEH